jgi:hypothetical protein
VLIEVKHLSKEGYSRVGNILSNAGYNCLFSSGSDLLASKERVEGIAIMLYTWFSVLSPKLFDKVLRKIFH